MEKLLSSENLLLLGVAAFLLLSNGGLAGIKTWLISLLGVKLPVDPVTPQPAPIQAPASASEKLINDLIACQQLILQTTPVLLGVIAAKEAELIELRNKLTAGEPNVRA